MAYTSRPLVRAGIALVMGASLSFAACSGDDSPSEPDMGTSDPDMGTVDMGEPDMGTPDTGVPMACNPVDGSGCPSGEFCVLNFSTATGACRTLPDQKAFGAPCDTVLQDCAPGLSCIFFQGEAEPICYQTCTASGSECQNVPDMTQAYGCAGPAGVTNPEFGACVPLDPPACNPLTSPCPMGQVCALNAAGNDLECATEGTVPLDGDCSMMNCARGGFCVPLMNGGRICAQPCDLAAPMCPAGRSCQDVNLDFGLCG